MAFISLGLLQVFLSDSQLPVTNRIAFLISFLANSLLLHRKATDCCVLILYPATFLTSSIYSNRLLVDSSGFPVYRIISSINRDNLTSSFPICTLCISFSYLIPLAKISKTYWIRVVTAPFSYSWSSRKCFQFFHIQYIGYGFVTYSFLCLARILLFSAFIMKESWILSSAFSVLPS